MPRESTSHAVRLNQSCLVGTAELVGGRPSPACAALGTSKPSERHIQRLPTHTQQGLPKRLQVPTRSLSLHRVRTSLWQAATEWGAYFSPVVDDCGGLYTAGTVHGSMRDIRTATEATSYRPLPETFLQGCESRQGRTVHTPLALWNGPNSTD